MKIPESKPSDKFDSAKYIAEYRSAKEAGDLGLCQRMRQHWESWHGVDSLDDAASVASGPVEVRHPQVSAPQLLNLSAALKRLGGNQTLLRDMARCFLEDSEQLLSDLRMALDANDAVRAHRCAHSLKGLSKNFDADSCADMAQLAENAASQGKLDDVRQMQAKLRYEVDRLIVALRHKILCDETPPADLGATPT